MRQLSSTSVRADWGADIDWDAEGNPLPDLSQVAGWSKASGYPPHDAGRALFGGWRLKDIEGK